ncbi:MAG: DUF1289 domain-containing protein [Gammaproteobacteria bacterium]|nr:DUF1289 domain-containing protein [Gammaproteobacteria bacterium]
MSAVESPCIGVCSINPALRRCIGCQRTLEEIAGWLRYTADQRHAIMGELERRRVAFEATLDTEQTDRQEPTKRGGTA